MLLLPIAFFSALFQASYAHGYCQPLKLIPSLLLSNTDWNVAADSDGVVTTQNGKIYYSTDGGTSFAVGSINGQIQAHHLQRICEKYNSDAKCVSFSYVYYYITNNGSELWKTSNLGTPGKLILNPSVIFGAPILLNDISANREYIYVAAGEPVKNNGGLLLSRDAGATWKWEIKESYLFSVHASPQFDKKLRPAFASGQNSIGSSFSYTFDNGKYFTTEDKVKAFGSVFQVPGVAFVIPQAPGGGVWRSDDMFTSATHLLPSAGLPSFIKDLQGITGGVASESETFVFLAPKDPNIAPLVSYDKGKKWENVKFEDSLVTKFELGHMDFDSVKSNLYILIREKPGENWKLYKSQCAQPIPAPTLTPSYTSSAMSSIKMSTGLFCIIFLSFLLVNFLY